jgi:hypothetical protein
MGDMFVVVAVVALVVALATYLTWMAGRLDKLAVRVESTWATLDAQLVLRALAAHELAHELDHPELHAAARAACDASPQDREFLENRLSRALRARRQSRPDAAVGPAPELVASITARRAGVQSAAPAAPVPPPRLPARTSPPSPVADLESSQVKSGLARQFYNEGVRDLMRLRRRRVVRLLHLYGRAKAPSYFEFDPSLPDQDGPSAAVLGGRQDSLD